MTNIPPEYKDILSKWIQCNSEFTLVYKATRDGCSAQTFHQLCDNKEGTVTVCYNTTGYVFGGYTSKPWLSKDRVFSSDNSAFLFRLKSSTGFEPKMYRPKPGREHNAILNDRNSGPWFGDDLGLFYGTVSLQKTGVNLSARRQNVGFAFARPNVSTSYFQGNGNLNVGCVYDMQEDTNDSFSGSNSLFTEIEVYTVTRAITRGPWRRVTQSNHQTLLSCIERYRPPEGSKLEAINILLLGAVGAGKSSFFNSVNSVFQREISGVARSGSTERSLTTSYRRYRVRSIETGETLKLRLCDTRGLETDGGLDVVDLLAVIEGHIPDRFQFNPTAPISPDCTGYKKSPSPDDQIHCVGFVIDGLSLDFLPHKILHIMKSLQQRLNAKGIPQVVILTKSDKVCSEVQEDVGQMFKSASIGDLVEQAGQLLGLPGSFVFPVKNCDTEVEIDESIDIPILLCLKQILRYVQDYIQDSASSD